MSSSVTVDWKAVREEELRSQALMRAELARLGERERQLRRRRAIAAGLNNATLADIPSARAPLHEMSSSELASLASKTRQALDEAERALDNAVAGFARERVRSASAQPWSPTRETPQEQPSPRLQYDPASDLAATLAAASAYDSSSSSQLQTAVAEANAVLDEVRLRCPDTDITALADVRARLGASAASDRAVVQELRYRAAQLIQQAKRDETLHQERERLLSLVAQTPPEDGEVLRRRVASATLEQLAIVEQDVVAALDEVSRSRARADAIEALHDSLEELGYTVGEVFESLLSEPNRQPEPVVVSSPYSAEHGVRVRVNDDHMYLSVVRRAGTAKDELNALAEDRKIQQQTCTDIASVAAFGMHFGVELVLGNEQPPGRRAPEMEWPANSERQESGSERTASDGNAAARRRNWVAAQQQKQAAHTMPRPGRLP